MTFTGMFEEGIKKDLNNIEKGFAKQKEFKDFSLKRDSDLVLRIQKG